MATEVKVKSESAGTGIIFRVVIPHFFTSADFKLNKVVQGDDLVIEKELTLYYRRGMKRFYRGWGIKVEVDVENV